MVTPRSRVYLDWIRTLACAWCRKPGPSEASHMGPRGVAMKASDFRALPKCSACHRFWHQHGRLPGSHMDGEQTTAWAAERALDLHDVWMTRT